MDQSGWDKVRTTVVNARYTVLVVAGAINSCAGNMPEWEDAGAWRTPPIANSSRAARTTAGSTNARRSEPSADSLEKTATDDYDNWAASFQTPNRCVLAAR